MPSNLFIYRHLLVIHSLLLTHRFVTHPEHKASFFVRSKHIDDLYSLMTQLRISCQQLGQAQIKQTSHSQINVSAFSMSTLQCYTETPKVNCSFRAWKQVTPLAIWLNSLSACTELHVIMASVAQVDKSNHSESGQASLLWHAWRSSILHIWGLFQDC